MYYPLTKKKKNLNRLKDISWSRWNTNNFNQFKNKSHLIFDAKLKTIVIANFAASLLKPFHSRKFDSNKRRLYIFHEAEQSPFSSNYSKKSRGENLSHFGKENKISERCNKIKQTLPLPPPPMFFSSVIINFAHPVCHPHDPLSPFFPFSPFSLFLSLVSLHHALNEEARDVGFNAY